MNKHKIGDIVKIKSLDWYNKNKSFDENIYFSSGVFAKDMVRFCGNKFRISTFYNTAYDKDRYLLITKTPYGEEDYYFCDWMFEETEQLEFDFGG